MFSTTHAHLSQVRLAEMPFLPIPHFIPTQTPADMTRSPLFPTNFLSEVTLYCSSVKLTYQQLTRCHSSHGEKYQNYSNFGVAVKLHSPREVEACSLQPQRGGRSQPAFTDTGDQEALWRRRHFQEVVQLLPNYSLSAVLHRYYFRNLTSMAHHILSVAGNTPEVS